MKFTQSILVALAALSIGEVAAQRGHRGGFRGGNKAASSSSVADAAATSSAADAAATSSVADAAATSSAADAAATSAASGNTGGGNTGGTGTSGDAASLTLDQSAIQTGSASAGGAIAEAGQSDSQTDNANFINFCANKANGDLTNGLQVRGGSCNGIPMGVIPSTNNMVSAVITFPTGQNDNIAANKPFTISVKADNLEAGTFTNPDTTYYSAPQFLKGGNIVGHTHVTVQDCNGGLPTTPLDPGTFAFFKGINTPIDQNGELTADVTQGLPAGFYRVCTMGAAANHQPLLMPIAQRGAQDDCRYFSVGGVGAGGTSGSGSTGGSGSGGSGSGGSGAGGSAASTSSATGSGNNATASSTASATTGSTTATGGNNGGRSGRGGRGGRRGRGRFMARAYIA